MSRWSRQFRPKTFIIFILILTAFICISNLRSSSGSRRETSSFARFRKIRKTAIQQINRFLDEKPISNSLLTHHPFDNSCKFPITNIYAKDIYIPETAERIRKLQCAVESGDLATMDLEGFMYVHPHFANYPKIEKHKNCTVTIIEGGLRQPKRNLTKDKFIEVRTLVAPINERFWVNADAFIVRCYNIDNNADSTKIIWEKPFAGIKDSKKPENEIILASDLTSFGKYGNKLREIADKIIERYSIDILGFDSTARTMFMRHLPRTVETMNRLGFHFFYGYNKIADNSMVNLAPILVGDMKEALEKPKHDESGDINIDWVLPTHDKMDPTILNFLWNFMKEKYGCESMFNEDISMKALGLFNYPQYEFQAGFTKSPADHYYRAYYLAVYDKWKYSACKNGEQVQEEFIRIWRRFAHHYKNVCHFGFTFVTTLTHESGFLLEIMDERLSSHLSELYLSGALDNTLSVIMGDHGNRIGYVQRMYTGRIEERMPLMAIRLPTGFSEKYPEEYRNFLDNKFKLTSNFDIHKTLNDVATMRFGSNRDSVPEDAGRGISLFDPIPINRTCYEAYIPENFCTCMIDVGNVTKPLRKIKSKENEVQKKDSIAVVLKWFMDEGLDGCLDVQHVSIENDLESMAINKYARWGLRSKTNLTTNEIIMKQDSELNYINHEFVVRTRTKNGEIVRMKIRTELYTEKSTNQMVFEPFVFEKPEMCEQYVSIFDVCQCLGLLDSGNLELRVDR